MNNKRRGKPVFTLPQMLDFVGEPEVLSVKIPSDLKDILKSIGESRNRNLSEIVVHALTEYGREFRNHASNKPRKSPTK